MKMKMKMKMVVKRPDDTVFFERDIGDIEVLAFIAGVGRFLDGSEDDHDHGDISWEEFNRLSFLSNALINTLAEMNSRFLSDALRLEP